MKTFKLLLSLFLAVILMISCEDFSHSPNKAETTNVESGSYEFDELEREDLSGDMNSELISNNNENSSRTKSKEESEIISRKLIKTGDVEFETDSIAKTRQRIKNAVNKYDAYISSDVESNQHTRHINKIEIRIPNESFDEFLSDCIHGVSYFDKKEIRVKDVTDEFLDVQSRIKIKKELEARYLQLLKKANTIEEIIEVEREIGKLRTQIESAEGRLKYLSSQTQYGTLSLEFYQRIERVKREAKRENRFVKGFKNGWNGLVSFLIALVNIWPFLLIILGVSILAYRKLKSPKSNN